MTWACVGEPEKQEPLAAAYGKAHKDGGGLLAPVGLAWQKALAADQDQRLHAADGSHPDPAGSYVAACVLYATMCGGDIEKFPNRLMVPDEKDPAKERVLIELTEEQGTRLRAAAAAVCEVKKARRRR